MKKYQFFNRDVSWLSFNYRVLLEAANEAVPLVERMRFLSIYSSNLDEFYRVRIPALTALHKLHKKDSIDKSDKKEYPDIINNIKEIIQRQLEHFGQILQQQLLPALKEKGIHLLYNEPVPEAIKPQVANYFFSQVLGYLQPVYLSNVNNNFFPQNNSLYLVAVLQNDGEEKEFVIVNIPSQNEPRFVTVMEGGVQYIIFLDDIIKMHLPRIFSNRVVSGCFSFKVTRDAELNLQDAYEGDVAEKIEKQIEKRDFGLATRFLYEPGIPETFLKAFTASLGLTDPTLVEGGVYHNLKDFAALPVNSANLLYEKQPPVMDSSFIQEDLLLDQLVQKDIMLHTPYQSYNTVLRFFNEAAVDPLVEEVYVTLYRVASESKIVNALISAAKNGKAVYVFVELKARFDEANNLKWAKKMKAAGVKIVYSIPNLKVHAKVALVKRRSGDLSTLLGLLATGNLNESTARFYTDHILLTSNQVLLQELNLLFLFLLKRERPSKDTNIQFNHLLVPPFNLQDAFIALIDNEIENAKQGLPAQIIIKLNNLEEKVLIKKLYDASNAGVEVRLLVRGICCLVPGVPHMSGKITVKRIVDRYLEHGRIFVFNNNNNPKVFMGSADWMNRNIYNRIEVCFPVYNEDMRKELIYFIDLQWQDNVQAVYIDKDLNNVPVQREGVPVQSQRAIYHYLKEKEGNKGF